MRTIDVVDMTGSKVDTIELSDTVFGIEPKVSLMHKVVVNQLANKRQGTQSALTRAEVRGGGKKPWRQKGTGRARHGSTRSPQWTHGGVAFAPKPRSYGFSINKKEKRLALKSAFSSKALADEIVVVDKITADTYKTRIIVDFLNAVGFEKKALIVLPEVDAKVIKSSGNISGVKTTQVNTVNVYDILNAGKLIIERDAVKKIEEVYA